MKKSNYEIMMVIHPASPELAHAEAIQAKQEIERNDGTVISFNAWGERALAFPINEITRAYYMLVNFKGTPDTEKKVNSLLKANSNILRHIIVRQAT